MGELMHSRFRFTHVLCAVTTNEVENEELTATSLGVVASELAWDAVLARLTEGPA